MDMKSLIIITVVALAIAALAAKLVINARINLARVCNTNSQDIEYLVAEDMLGMIVGMPLSDFIAEGDNVEIIVRTNGHPIASHDYVAKTENGRVTLTSASVVADQNNFQNFNFMLNLLLLFVLN